MQKKLSKSNDKKLFGVCGGIAEFFDLDPTLIRIAFLLAFFCFGSGLLLYLICAIVMPSAPANYKLSERQIRKKLTRCIFFLLRVSCINTPTN